MVSNHSHLRHKSAKCRKPASQNGEREKTGNRKWDRFTRLHVRAHVSCTIVFKLWGARLFGPFRLDFLTRIYAKMRVRLMPRLFWRSRAPVYFYPAREGDPTRSFRVCVFSSPSRMPHRVDCHFFPQKLGTDFRRQQKSGWGFLGSRASSSVAFQQIE